MTMPFSEDLRVRHDDRRHEYRLPFMAQGVAEDELVVGAEFIDVTASDISESGLMLHCTRMDLLTPYGLLQLVFTPLDDGDPIQLMVQIMWIHRRILGETGECSMGCTFTRTPRPTVKLLLDRARAARAREGW